MCKQISQNTTPFSVKIEESSCEFQGLDISINPCKDFDSVLKLLELAPK